MIPGLSPLWPENRHRLCDFYFYFFDKVCFIAQNVVCPANVPRALENVYSFSRPHETVCRCHSRPAGGRRRRARRCPRCFSAPRTCALLRAAPKPLAVRARPRSAPQPLRCLPRTVWCSVLGCMVSVVTMSQRTGPFSLCGDLESLGLSVVRSHPV